MHGQHDRGFVQLCHGASLIVPDGIGVVWAGRRCGYQVPARVAGIGLVEALATSPGRRLRLVLRGAAPARAEEDPWACRRPPPGAPHGCGAGSML